MRSTFCPNRIFERQSSQNRHFGLKFSPKRENSALPMKNCTKRSLRVMRSTFLAKIALMSVKILKIVTLANFNSRQRGKTVRFSWKICTKRSFSGHVQHVLAKSHFWASKFSKSSLRPEILFKKAKQCDFDEKSTKTIFFRSCRERFGQIAFVSVKVLKIATLAWNSRQKRENRAFYETCTKRSFQVMRSTFWPNRICER